MDKEEYLKDLVTQLTEVNERLEILDMMDERLFKIKELLQRIEAGNLPEIEEKEVRSEIKNLEEQLSLLNREKNIQS